MAERTIAGRYELLEPLRGKGEWLAEDTDLGRQVALRLLDAQSEPFEARARAAAALAHPHIARLYEYGESDGTPFIVGEYLPGGSLEARLAAGEPVPAEAVDRLTRDIASALAHAHAQGTAHGELTAETVQFDAEGRAKVTDFVTAPAAGAGAASSAAGDVRALGALAFGMLTGRDPAGAPPLEELRPDAPPALVAAVSAALSDDPRVRPADGGALVELLGPEATAVRPPEEQFTQVIAPPPVAAAEAPAPRRWTSVALVLVLLALLAAGIGAAFLAAAARDGGGVAPPPSLSVPPASTEAPSTSEPPEETTTTPPAPPPTTTTAEPTTSTVQTTTRPTTTTRPETTVPPATTAPPPPPTDTFTEPTEPTEPPPADTTTTSEPVTTEAPAP